MDKIEPVAWQWRYNKGGTLGGWVHSYDKRSADCKAKCGLFEVRALYAESAVSALLSENARLREALNRIVTLDKMQNTGFIEQHDIADALRDARAALSAQEDA